MKIFFNVLKYVMVLASVILLGYFCYSLYQAKLNDLANTDTSFYIMQFGLTAVLCGLILTIVNVLFLIVSIISYIVIRKNKKLKENYKLRKTYVYLITEPFIVEIIYIIFALIVSIKS